MGSDYDSTAGRETGDDRPVRPKPAPRCGDYTSRGIPDSRSFDEFTDAFLDDVVTGRIPLGRARQVNAGARNKLLNAELAQRHGLQDGQGYVLNFRPPREGRGR